MEQKEQDEWMLSPSTNQPKAHSVRAEDSRPLQDSPQTTRAFKSVLPCHAVTGARPYCSPEYSPDFHKIVSHIRADTFIPLQPFTLTRVPYSEKKKLLDKQEEIQEVKQLDEWKPAVDMFKAVLKDVGDRAT